MWCVTDCVRAVVPACVLLSYALAPSTRTPRGPPSVLSQSAAVNQSSMMLDLSQMAALFRLATARSLCLVDEFGKGTIAQES